jgi:hypothetical protein
MMTAGASGLLPSTDPSSRKLMTRFSLSSLTEPSLATVSGKYALRDDFAVLGERRDELTIRIQEAAVALELP